jgi:3-hydroxyisobutyrate dehydrogenase-like beta-hydroxyacid dehydrogenase
MIAKDKTTIGIVGLGIMGGAIARNLLAAGWRVSGYDTDRVRCSELASSGALIKGSAGELAREASVIITSLPKAEALAETAQAVANAGVERRIVVETSTFALDDKLAAQRTLAAANHLLLDCPLSGTGAQAEARDVVVYASGDSESIATLTPLFADFARAAYDLGAFGNGTRMKFVANLLVAIHNVATAEAFVLGMKAGLDPRKILEVIASGAGNSRIFELRGPMMAQGRYQDATMRLSLWQKDMALIGDFAASLGCPTPLFNATQPIYAQAIADGYGPQDTAAVCAVLEAIAGLAPR